MRFKEENYVTKNYSRKKMLSGTKNSNDFKLSKTREKEAQL